MLGHEGTSKLIYERSIKEIRESITLEASLYI